MQAYLTDGTAWQAAQQVSRNDNSPSFKQVRPCSLTREVAGKRWSAY